MEDYRAQFIDIYNKNVTRPGADLAVLHIIKPATNPTLFVGDDACIIPHDGPCPIFYPEIQQIPPKNKIRPTQE